MRTFLIAATAAAALAAPAAAQEVTADRPFNGIYVGAAGGYDVQPNDVGSRILFDRNLDGNFNDTVTTAAGANAFGGAVGGFCNGAATAATGPGNTTGASRPCRNDSNGFAYYGRVGIDSQSGNIVVGAVAEFGKTEISDAVSAFSTTPANYVMYREVDWEGSVRGRVGYAANTTLFYGTFGVGYAKIDRDFSSSNTLNAYSFSGKQRQFGILGGGGIEQKLGRNFSVGLEYMHHRYQDGDFRVGVTRGSQPATNPFVLAPNTTGTDFRRSDDKFRWHSVRATAAFRF